MKKAFSRTLIFVYIAVLLFGVLTIGAGASSSYETFTYSQSGSVQNSPNAYEVYGIYSADRMMLSRYRSTFVEKATEYETVVNGKSASDAKSSAENAWDKGGLNALNKPNAIRSDSEGRLYIADTENNRIVILKNDYTVLTAIDYFESAVADVDTFSKPKGVFVNDDFIYVSDTGNTRRRAEACRSGRQL